MFDKLHPGGHEHLPSLPGGLPAGAHDQGSDGVPMLAPHGHVVSPHEVARPGEEGEVAVAPEAVTGDHTPEVPSGPGGHPRGHEGVIPANMPQDLSSCTFKHSDMIIEHGCRCYEVGEVVSLCHLDILKCPLLKSLGVVKA